MLVHGAPQAIRVDNRLVQPLSTGAPATGTTIHHIQPGKPDQNAYIERFNRTCRTEVLNAHLFEPRRAAGSSDTWLRVYNEGRPHDSLVRVPPLTFLPRPNPRLRLL